MFATSDPCADVATGFRYPWSRDSGTCLAALFLEDVHVTRVVAACEVKEQSDEVPHCICMRAFWFPCELRIGDEWIFLRDSGNF